MYFLWFEMIRTLEGETKMAKAVKKAAKKAPAKKAAAKKPVRKAAKKTRKAA